jgi:hypothetical protein
MNEYTFKLSFEMAKTVEAETVEAAREALVYDETHWLVERPNGDIISTVPRLLLLDNGRGHNES